MFSVSPSEAQVAKLVPQLVEERGCGSRSSKKKGEGPRFCFLGFSKVRVSVEVSRSSESKSCLRLGLKSKSREQKRAVGVKVESKKVKKRELKESQ